MLLALKFKNSNNGFKSILKLNNKIKTISATEENKKYFDLTLKLFPRDFNTSILDLSDSFFGFGRSKIVIAWFENKAVNEKPASTDIANVMAGNAFLDNEVPNNAMNNAKTKNIIILLGWPSLSPL